MECLAYIRHSGWCCGLAFSAAEFFAQQLLIDDLTEVIIEIKKQFHIFTCLTEYGSFSVRAAASSRSNDVIGGSTT